jgi:hypothetical protein
MSGNMIFRTIILLWLLALSVWLADVWVQTEILRRIQTVSSFYCPAPCDHMPGLVK